MFIGLDRKRFEATLIDGASPRRVMVGMRALRVGDGDPPQHFREFSILSSPEEEVSVIRHCTFYSARSRVLSGSGMFLLDVASSGKPKTMNSVFGTIWGSLGGAVLLSITLSACGTVPPVPPAPVAAVHRNDPPAGESSAVQSLQRQLRERDKRIGELESQLNVLKLIDQDVEKRKKPSRPLGSLRPVE